MPAIHIQRSHELGLARACQVAREWAEVTGRRLGVMCTVVPGDAAMTVEFTRSGVSGELKVEADRYTLDARLGLLLGAFSKQIEAEIGASLDALIAGRGPEAQKA